MILYVNGDSHTAAACAVNDHAFAEDDLRYVAQGRRPHPDNLVVSWGMMLSKLMNLGLKCDAESASSNARILRTTKHFLSQGHKPDLVVIGWSTWEREEWFDEETNHWYQVTASGQDQVPIKWADRYRLWMVGLDYKIKEDAAHNDIHKFHLELLEKKIPHLFFNAMWHFSNRQSADWHGCYLGPYDADWSFMEWAKRGGYPNKHMHFGPEAQRRWADILFSRLTENIDSV